MCSPHLQSYLKGQPQAFLYDTTLRDDNRASKVIVCDFTMMAGRHNVAIMRQNVHSC